MTPDNPYDALGVDRTASFAEIRRAWREIAKTNHPDRFPGDESKERRFKQAAAAWTLLSDSDSRAQYDRGARRSAWAGTDTDELRQHLRLARDAVEDVATVLFDAILPVYIEAFERGLGAELVWRLHAELNDRTLLDRVQRSARPGFAARQRSTQLRQTLRLRLDSRVLYGADGTPRVASLTQVTERDIRWSAITIWVGSLQALGVQDQGERQTLLLVAITREIVRSLQAQLPPDLRPLSPHQTTPFDPDPIDFRVFSRRDSRHVAIAVARVVVGFTVVIALMWALGWVLTGTPAWPY